MTQKPVIVCATDFSENAALALRFAAWIVQRWSGRIVVVSVVEPLLADAARIEGFKSVPEDTERALRQWIDRHARSLARTERMTPRMVVGKPAEEILRCARTEEADLLVIGTQGLSGYRRLIFGSIARKVLRDADRPVLVVPLSAPLPPTDSTRRLGGVILAPVDLQHSAPDDIQAAAAVAKNLKLPLVLLYVVSPPTRIPGLAQAFAKQRDAAVKAARADLQRRADSLKSSSLRVEPMVVEGAPAEEIARVAKKRKARVIVMGLGGGEAGGAPGSVAYHVLSAGAAPVLALASRGDASLSH